MMFRPLKETVHHTQAWIGETRHRLYTIDELVDALGLRTGEIKSAITRHKIKPVFPKRPYKYRLNDFKAALNADAGEARYRIEKAVPLPERGTKRTPMTIRLTELIQKMEPGDSVELLDSECVRAMLLAKTLGIKMASRTVIKGESRRIWRLE